MLYEDDPEANLKFLKTLSRKEINLYIEGYLMACAHMREALSLGSSEILVKLLSGDDVDLDKDTLKLLLKVLDYHRALIEKKEAHLHKTFPNSGKLKNLRIEQRK